MPSCLHPLLCTTLLSLHYPLYTSISAMSQLVSALLAIAQAFLFVNWSNVGQAGIQTSNVTAMSAAEEDIYSPAAKFASAAYCPSSQTAEWTCGRKYTILYLQMDGDIDTE